MAKADKIDPADKKYCIYFNDCKDGESCPEAATLEAMRKLASQRKTLHGHDCYRDRPSCFIPTSRYHVTNETCRRR